MKRPMMTVAAFVLGAAFVVPVAGDDRDAGEAIKLAKKLTEEGAATFNTADAKAMAASYADDAKLVLQSRDENGAISVKEYEGREEIEKFYADIFKDPRTIRAKNIVEYAKLLAPDILVIAGTFVPNQTAANPLKIPFYQVRLKQGDKWLINSLRIFVISEKS